MFDLKSVKVGMKYQDVRDQIIKSEGVILETLPNFCGSDYEVIENPDAKKKVYILKDYATGIIIDVTNDFNKAVKCDRANRNIREILKNNGY